MSKSKESVLIDKLKEFEILVFKREGIGSIINELENKYIDDSNFEYLMKMINNHFEFSTELLKKDLTPTRLEIILNYLNEVVSYLEMDLQIDKLPNK